MSGDIDSYFNAALNLAKKAGQVNISNLINY